MKRSLILTALVALSLVSFTLPAGAQTLAYSYTPTIQLPSLSQTFDLDVSQVLGFQRNSTTTGWISVRATNGSTRTIRVNNGAGSPWTWNNTAPSHNAELTLDLLEAAANRPNDFRLKLRKVRIWYMSSLVYYFADHGTEIILEARNPGSSSWSFVKIHSYGSPNHAYYATVTLKRSSGNKQFHLLQNPGVYSIEEEDYYGNDVEANRMLYPMPADNSFRSGVFNLLSYLIAPPFNLRIRDYERVWNSATDRIVHRGSWW